MSDKDEVQWVEVGGTPYFFNVTKFQEAMKKHEIPEAERGQLRELMKCACLTASVPCDEHRHLLPQRRLNQYAFGDGDGSGLHNQLKDADAAPAPES